MNWLSVKSAPDPKDLKQSQKSGGRDGGREREREHKNNLVFKKWLLTHFKFHVQFAVLLSDSADLEHKSLD